MSPLLHLENLIVFFDKLLDLLLILRIISALILVEKPIHRLDILYVAVRNILTYLDAFV